MIALSRFLEKMLKALVIVANAAMLLLVFGQVITRYVFGWTPHFGEELARYLFVWVVFFRCRWWPVTAGICASKP